MPSVDKRCKAEMDSVGMVVLRYKIQIMDTIRIYLIVNMIK